MPQSGLTTSDGPVFDMRVVKKQQRQSRENSASMHTLTREQSDGSPL